MDGPEFYDDEAVFATYMRHRGREENPNDSMEEPVVWELVGDVAGLRVLDLGCGAAEFGREAHQKRCRTYVGVEGSQKMAAAARETLAGTTGRVVHTTIESWEFPPDSFDLVIARLSLHYVEDFYTLCQRIHHTLVEAGRFVFSVEHPVITSSDRGWMAGTARQDWIVDDYFSTGLRVTSWLGGTIRKYHRTIEQYFGALQASGLVVDALREAHPRREYFATEETYARRRRIPLFLLMAATKV